MNVDSSITVTGQYDPTGSITVINQWKNGARIVLGCSVGNDNDVTNSYYMSPGLTLGDTSVLTAVQIFSVLVTDSRTTKTMIDLSQVTGVVGRFEINQGYSQCEVKYNTSGALKDQWTSVDNATNL